MLNFLTVSGFPDNRQVVTLHTAFHCNKDETIEDKCSAVAEMGDCLAIINISHKVRDAVPIFGAIGGRKLKQLDCRAQALMVNGTS